MKVKRSTGIKRITIACTFLLPIFILFLAGLVLAVNLEVIAGFLTHCHPNIHPRARGCIQGWILDFGRFSSVTKSEHITLVTCDVMWSNRVDVLSRDA